MIKGTDKLKKIQAPYVKSGLCKYRACWRCVTMCPKQVIGKAGFLWHKHIVFKDSDKCPDARNVSRYVLMGYLVINNRELWK